MTAIMIDVMFLLWGTILAIFAHLQNCIPPFFEGSFHNYVDKMRWVGGPKVSIFVYVQGEKCPLPLLEVEVGGQIRSKSCRRSY